MIEAVLFDLDDTLLGNNMENFVPRYFALLGRYARPFIADQELFFHVLQAGTETVMRNVDTAVSNRDVFWAYFQQHTGLDPAEAEPFFEQFYRGDFNQLETITQRRLIATELMRACIEKGLQIVIATNPVFPRTAVESRLRWAGVPVDDHDYALVTTYENMHATKPHTIYYREILERIGTAPSAALMVGDDWRNDIEPAAAMGLWTYWIETPGLAAPDPELPTAQGSLEELYELVKGGWLEMLSAKMV